MSGLTEPFIAAVRDVLPDLPDPVALHEPLFAGREWEYVKDCLDSGWVSTNGRYVESFEERLAESCGTRHVVAVASGTAALHVALRLAGVQSGDEVVLPALTFVATANAVHYCGAIPHFADCEERTLGLDPAKLADYLRATTERQQDQVINRRTGRRIAAIVPMHSFGHPVDMDPLLDLAAEFGLPVVEDATESLGSCYKGRPAGSIGQLGVLSFNGNKIITTGGGGAILTNDDDLRARAKHLTTTAKLPHPWEYVHDEIGYNYRLPNLNAALGLAQLEQLDGFVAAKRRLAADYRQRFADQPGLRFFVEPEFATSNYWLNAVLLDEERSGERDQLLQQTNAAGLLTRPVWRPLHKLAIYADCPRMDLPVTESLARRLINLPSSPRLAMRHAA